MNVVLSRALIAASVLLLVAAALAPWTEPAGDQLLVLFGATDRYEEPGRAGWELVASLAGRDEPDTPLSTRDGEVRMYADEQVAVLGPALTLAALVLALAALIVRRRAAKL